MVVNKFFIILALVLSSCVYFPRNKFEPKPPKFPPSTPSSFYEKVDDLFDGEIKKLPKDKQDHYSVSKMIATVTPTESESDFATAIESSIIALRIGYDKELMDVGAEDAVDWDLILNEIKKMDSQIIKDELDQGDLFADWLGISCSSSKYSFLNIK